MIDPDLKYCTNCKDEYMPGIANCPACGVALITGSQMLEMEEEACRKQESRAGELDVDDDLVSIRQGPLQDMKYIAGLLQRERIGALLKGDESSCGKGCCTSLFILQVRREDAMDAMAVLEKEFRRTTALDHHDTSLADNVFDLMAGTVVCPACGHSFSPSTPTCPDCGLCFE